MIIVGIENQEEIQNQDSERVTPREKFNIVFSLLIVGITTFLVGILFAINFISNGEVLNQYVK